MQAYTHYQWQNMRNDIKFALSSVNYVYIYCVLYIIPNSQKLKVRRAEWYDKYGKCYKYDKNYVLNVIEKFVNVHVQWCI